MRLNSLQRLFWVLLLSLGTTSCGFTPVYEHGEKTGEALSDIAVAPPENDRASYIFVVELENRIGRNLGGSSILEHNMSLSEQGVVGTTDRIQMNGTVNYKLVSSEDKQILFSGSVNSFVSYSINRSLPSTTRQDATKRLMVILANLVTSELTVELYNTTYD